MGRSRTEGKRRTRRARTHRGKRVLLGGAAAGAAFTYLFDPDQGRRRRALLRDRFEAARHDLAETGEIVLRDGTNRGRGVMADLDRLLRDAPPSDAHIHHQVRNAIVATSSHPGALHVRVDDGHVTLVGPVLSHEVERVRTAVLGTVGVQALDEQLELHDEPGNLPALQGEGSLGGVPPELLQEHWAPAPRAVAGAMGGVLLVYGLSRRGLTGLVLTGAGGLLLARASTNLPVRQLTGIGAGPAAIEVAKSIDIDAPVEKVWAFWDDYEAFPTFMSHVRQVDEVGEGQSHWKVDGPLGSTIEWDAEVTERRPNEVLAWQSRPGSMVQHTGEIALEPSNGGSRVHVRLAYNPAAGAAGHAIARLFGTDPRSQLDDDLLRMKTMVETGKSPRDAATRQT